MLFSRKTPVGLRETPPETLHPEDVDVREGVIRFRSNQFRLSDVMSASINNDPVAGDGIGGSALFKTREFVPDRGVVQKIYKATFDETAIKKLVGIADTIRTHGGNVSTYKLLDSAFRRAYF